ncbi:MAG: DUF177 domain-containing protein [Clostridium sp.]|nr:DUF177 domain-containing protein [Clostridium sp.]
MLMNLTDVFTSEGKERREVLTYEPNSFSYIGNLYRISKKSPVNMSLFNIGEGRALIRGSMKLVMDIPCDRCLRTVKEPMEINFEREVFSPEAAGQMEEQDEQEFMHEYEMDVEAFLNGEILMNMPRKVLCKPDCRGICKNCGFDLNKGDCGCDTFVPDPRMAVIKDIFNENKEV